MGLEKIVITNFKSYGGTYVIGPFDRFSCIIGPNGSGKSNKLDAISFVFNVSNNSLRIKNLRSLIAYGETETKNISNTIADEEIKSKYIFNGIKVSLKQYNMELEKLNIFSKIKNFVIHQGDVIKSDVDLLNIIEISSGSNAYIQQYDEFNVKLAAQNRELSLKYERRKDCLEMIKEFNEVKEKEKIFKQLIEEKEDLQKKVYEYEIGTKLDDINKLKLQVDKLESSKNDSEENMYYQLCSEVNEIKKEASRMQKEYFEKESEISFLKNKISNKFEEQNRIKAAMEKRVSQQEEIRCLEVQLRRCYDDLARIPSFFENNHKLSSFLMETGKYDNSKSPRENFENILCDLEAEYSKKASDYEKQLNELALSNFDSISKKDTIQGSLKQMKHKLNKLNSQNKEIERGNREKQEKINNLNNEIFTLRTKIEDKLQAYEKIISDENKLNHELSEVMREILSNKARKNDQARKMVVKNVIGSLKEIFSGVYGSVIDLISPTQKKYETAIGTLLSKYDQAVVVENEKVAFDCLKYLKETKACKLTFLPITRISYFSKNEKPFDKNINDCQFIYAKNCINYDIKYEIIVNFIFKDSLIVESTTIAKNLAFNHKYSGKVCTINGILFTSFGLITGGKQTANKFEENIIDHLLEKRKGILSDLKKNKDRRNAFSNVEMIKEKIEELVNKKASIKILNLNIIDKSEENEVFRLEEELVALNDVLKDYENEKGKIKEQLKQIESNVFYPIMRKVDLTSISQYKDKVREELVRQETIIKIDHLKEQITLLKEDFMFVNDNDSHVCPNASDITALENSLNLLYGELERIKSKFKLKNSILRDIESKRSEANGLIMNYKLHISRMEEDLKDLINYATLETGIDDIGEQKDTVLPSNEELKNLKIMLDDINKKMEQNAPGIATDDNSIQAKYNKLNAEYEVAKATVMTTKTRFLEIKRLRMDCFLGCFTKVADAVPRIYSSLNYTDDAHANCAYLAFEGDPFANNLKYYLMSPNKRFTEFKELSGGERSMALVAFLFALSRYRTPPFYIFDEVDSALDNINVERLSDYILGSHDQFLVVSLKHHFFKKAESLFGVYTCPFEKKSKILSYRLYKASE